MQNLPAPLAQALDRLDDAIDCASAIAALMFSTHNLNEVDRLHIARLLHTLHQALAVLDQPRRPDDTDPAGERENLLMCLEGVALLMNGTDPLDVNGRDQTFLLLDQVSQWQRAALNAYAEAVRVALLPPGAAVSPIADAAPRRRRKDSHAA